MGWIGWSLLSAFFAAVTAVLAKVGVDRVDANLATAVRTSVVFVFAWMVAWLARAPAGAQPFSRKTLALSRYIRARDRAFVDLLLSRDAAGRSVSSGARSIS